MGGVGGGASWFYNMLGVFQGIRVESRSSNAPWNTASHTDLIYIKILHL